MMITLQKYEAEGASHGILVPADQTSAEFVGKLIKNDVVTSNFVKPRNYRFHKKWFSLVKFAFDNWTPPEIKHRGSFVQKDFDNFRGNIIILTGHNKTVFNLDGSFEVKPKSISFAKMNEKEFDVLYSKTKVVILDNILINYTKEDFEEVIKKLETWD